MGDRRAERGRARAVASTRAHRPFRLALGHVLRRPRRRRPGCPDRGPPVRTISFTGARFAQADVRLLSPILPSKVVCVGKNYAAHIAEMNTGDAPKQPLLFLKPSTSVIGPGDAIRIPPGSTNVHHEAELAVVIGARGARHVTPEQARRASSATRSATTSPSGTCRRATGSGPAPRASTPSARSARGSRPTSPASGLDPADLEVTCTVDGELRQQGRTSQLIFDVPT